MNEPKDKQEPRGGGEPGPQGHAGHDHAHHPPGRCIELADVISEYVDGEIPAELKLKVEEHLHGCSNCEKFVESVRRTKDLAHLLPALELPPDRLARISEAVKHRLEDPEGC